MIQLSRAMIEDKKNNIPTSQKQTEKYCSKRNELKENLQSNDKNAISANTKSAIGNWLAYEIIFQEKAKTESDVMEIAIQDELEILKNYAKKLQKIQRPYKEYSDESLNYKGVLRHKKTQEEQFLNSDKIAKKFCELHKKIFVGEDLSPFFLLKKQISCLNKVISVQKHAIKRKLNKSNLPSTSLENSDSKEPKPKRLKK